MCGGVWFFFLCKLSSSLLTGNEPLFPLRQRNKQICFPHITSFFCQFCKQTFYFYSLLDKLFFHHFLLNIFFFPNTHSPHPHIIWSAPYCLAKVWKVLGLARMGVKEGPFLLSCPCRCLDLHALGDTSGGGCTRLGVRPKCDTCDTSYFSTMQCSWDLNVHRHNHPLNITLR